MGKKKRTRKAGGCKAPPLQAGAALQTSPSLGAPVGTPEGPAALGLRLADLERDLAQASRRSEELATDLRQEAARRAALDQALSAAEARVEDTRTWAKALRSEIRALADMLRAEQAWRETVLVELRQLRSRPTEGERHGAEGLASARLDEQAASEAGPSTSNRLSGGAARAESDGSEALDDRPELDRLAARLRSRHLREQLDLWRAARDGSGLPRFDAAWATVSERAPLRAVLAEVGPDGWPGSLRASSGPDTLPLDRALGAGSPQALPAGPLAAGWLRCSRTGRPVLEFAQVVLGTTRHGYERLVLPFSSDGSRPDRLLGLSVAERHV